jgi:hypothetical protein
MGGNFDSGTPAQITNSTGLGLGDGFTHFVTAPMVQMYKMEHLFEKGSTGSMALELENFINLSMDLVNSVASSVSADAPAITSDLSVTTHHEYLNAPGYGVDQLGDIDNGAGYLGEAMTRYDNAVNKQAAVFKEVWYSMWGSGVEIYNAHRRSGYPKLKDAQSSTRGIADIQYPTFRATSTATGQRNFPTIFNYPLGEFNLNSSFPERTTAIENFLYDDVSQGLDFNFSWVSVDNKNTVTKIEFYVSFNEVYSDFEGGAKTASHKEYLFKTIDNPKGNRETEALSMTQDDLYQLYKDDTFAYDITEGDGS